MYWNIKELMKKHKAVAANLGFSEPGDAFATLENPFSNGD